jgi:sugar O-acyltransferase (sialic acid O-acetyltransferase NeuD family)
MATYFIDQINVSDSEYVITAINDNLSSIEKGQYLFSYESSKTTFDVVAEESGFLYFNKNIKIGNAYKVGTPISVVSKHKLQDLRLNEIFENISKNDILENEENQIITKKAIKLIEEFKIEKNVFSDFEVVNEDIVQNYISKNIFSRDFQNISFYYAPQNDSFFKKHLKRLAVIGAGKAALQVLDTVISQNLYEIVVYYDSNPKLSNCSLFGIPIQNHLEIDKICKDYESGIFEYIVISFSGDIEKRREIFELLSSRNIPFSNIIHPTTVIERNVIIGNGNLFFANTRVGPFTVIGDNNILSANCSIDHHNYLGSHNTFGPSVCFSGSCNTGSSNKFGTGIFIEPNVSIGNQCIISSGVVLSRNINNRCLVRNLNKIEIKDL